MKICYIAGIFPKLSEPSVINEIAALADRGKEVYIFSLFPAKENLQHEKVDSYHLLNNTFYLPNPYKRSNQIKFFLSAMRTMSVLSQSAENTQIKIFGVAAANYISSIIQRDLHLDIDVFHSHFNGLPPHVAMLVSKKLSIPFTFAGHAIDIFVNPNVKALRNRMENALATITDSHYNKEYLHDLTKIDRGRIHIVRACTAIDEFGKIKRDEEDYSILTVGRLVEKKGIKYGILAVKRLAKEYPQVRYKIIGTGPAEDELRGLVKELGLEENVKFLGSLNDSSIKIELSKAQVSILPCIITKNGDRDVCPLTLQEAMLAKVPVISSNIASIPELIEDGKDGLLTPPGDVKSLAKAIKILFDDEDMRNKMGKNGRDKIEREFNIHKEVEKLIKIWSR